MRYMHAVSTSQIADILHFNDNMFDELKEVKYFKEITDLKSLIM